MLIDMSSVVIYELKFRYNGGILFVNLKKGETYMNCRQNIGHISPQNLLSKSQFN